MYVFQASACVYVHVTNVLKIFTLLPEQNLVIRDFVWDKNLRGRTNKRLVEEMFDQLGLENDEIGPKTVVLVRCSKLKSDRHN